MNPRYYAARAHTSTLIDGEKHTTVHAGEPVSSYTEAVEEHARRLAAAPWMRDETPLILLDLASITGADETTWKRILNDDPAIRAVFHMGYQLGREEADRG